MGEIETWKRRLQLAPHPEGGFYRETFRSGQAVHGPAGRREASTAIFYALPAGGYSGWHRVTADEVWHWYAGGALDLHLLDEGGLRTLRLGGDLEQGALPQQVVPAGVWQAAVAVERDVLCGCTVAPGFTFGDFTLADASLAEAYPALREPILRWLR